MATAVQLRRIRKKYRLGEFKKSRKVYKRAGPSYSMAKRRKKSYRRKSFGSTGGIWGPILGVAGYVAYENYIEPRIPLQEPILSFAELAMGLWLSKKGGFVGNFGKAAVMINAYQLIKFYSANLNLGGLSASPTTGMFAY